MVDSKAGSSSEVENIRNLTVLGHVDHGKTTFVDCLLAANNIISKRSAGKVRYMDSREDEQERGITMESSAISLYFTLRGSPSAAARTYTLNLIDTPGHVDFSSEVSTAARTCDGAIVILDAVEGVCTQTIAVLRQVWTDRIRPVLVINKMDRLITELKFQPTEAYHHLSRLIEQVNAIIGSFYQSERMEDDYLSNQRKSNNESNADELADKLQSVDIIGPTEQEKDDEDIYFSPERGNVIFASAIDGWAFRTEDFARIFSVKFGFNSNVLARFLWGDFFWDSKVKRVIGPKLLRGRNLKPLFVQIALENIWAVYTAVLLEPNNSKVLGIVKTLNLSIPPRQLEVKDQRQVLCTILSQWLPLVSATVQAVVEMLPSPLHAQAIRLDEVILRESGTSLPKLRQTNEKLAHDLLTCNGDDDACLIGYVSKMFAVSRSHLPARRAMEAEGEDDDGASLEVSVKSDEVLVGFARLYSGVLRPGTFVSVILPRYDRSLPMSDPRNRESVQTVRIGALFFMMGRELRPAMEVKAGNIFAVTGLDAAVSRCATLCASNSRGVVQESDDSTRKYLLNLAGGVYQSRPFVRFAVEPTDPANMSKLVSGLELLSRSDPCVEIYQDITGENVIVTAGELHFERCMKDLQERFAKVEIQVSQPIVPFRETITRGSPEPFSKTLENGLSIKLSIQLLPASVLSAMLQNPDTFGILSLYAKNKFDDHKTTIRKAWGEIVDAASLSSDQPLSGLLWSAGPQQEATNILLDLRDHKLNVNGVTYLESNLVSVLNSQFLDDLDRSLEVGFQKGVQQGPLCGEPLYGLMINLLELNLYIDENTTLPGDFRSGHFLHICQAGLKDAIDEHLSKLPLRLMLAMYSCEIQASGSVSVFLGGAIAKVKSADVLGKVYAVISRCHGYVVSEDLHEGTSYFIIKARIPAVESFGFANEIRKRTSGSANPQLVFGGYEVLNIDPFWVPTTEEELEDWGDKADHENTAKIYMERVREQKGLFVGKKLVMSAEKQRTLKH